MSEKKDASTTKTDKSKEESKLDKVLDNLEKVKGLLETLETRRDIPLVSGKTKWEPVLSRGFEETPEIKRPKEVKQFFLSLGLGRGVDVTRTKPFHNKTAFQIKKVDLRDLIGTDEGGLLVDFTKTVYSTSDTSVEYQASLDVVKALGKHVPALAAVSAPFTFTTSGELSRSEYSIGVVVGLRILNRTVSFKQTMDSVPTSLVVGVSLDKFNVLSSDSVLRAHFRLPFLEGEQGELTEEQKKLEKLEKEDTFEKRLTNWILEYYKKESAGQSKTGRMPNPTEPGESGEGEAASNEESSTDKPLPLKDIDPDTLETLCEAYTWTTGVTHYVSSIKLGAEMYKTMDLKGYENTFKANASVNILDIFTVGDDKTDKERGIFRQKRDIQNKYATKVIGRIKEVKQHEAAKKDDNHNTTVPGDDDTDTQAEAGLDVHPRKSYKVDPRDEAVIGYELRSVASLIVDDERLAEKMALAARKYIEEKRREKGEVF